MKLAIIGAGGVRTPLLIESIHRRQERLGILELALMDIDLPRLMTISSVTHNLEESNRLSFKIIRTDDLDQAIKNADFVITTFRVGGIDSRVIDERVPLELGVLGQETTGAGGFAMGVRSIPVILQIHERMKLLCPDAWLINFANPAGMLIQALQNVTQRKRMVGICDAPSQFLAVFAALLETSRDAVELDYFGLNHLGWIREIHHAGKDHLPQFIHMLIEMGHFPQFPFDAGLVSSLGMIPNEYLYYYYYSKQAVTNIQRSGLTRGEVILRENKLLFNKLNFLLEKGDYEAIESSYKEYIGKRGATYMQNETGGQSTQEENPLMDILANSTDEGYAGVAMDVIESLLGKQDRRMILNIPNRFAVPGMAETDIVEIPALVSRNKIETIPGKEVPDLCLGLMKIIKAYEHLTVKAAMTHSMASAEQALCLHPLVGDYQVARKILEGYQNGHGDYYPKLT